MLNTKTMYRRNRIKLFTSLYSKQGLGQLVQMTWANVAGNMVPGLSLLGHYTSLFKGCRQTGSFDPFCEYMRLWVQGVFVEVLRYNWKQLKAPRLPAGQEPPVNVKFGSFQMRVLWQLLTRKYSELPLMVWIFIALFNGN